MRWKAQAIILPFNSPRNVISQSSTGWICFADICGFQVSKLSVFHLFTEGPSKAMSQSPLLPCTWVSIPWLISSVHKTCLKCSRYRRHFWTQNTKRQNVQNIFEMFSIQTAFLNTEQNPKNSTEHAWIVPNTCSQIHFILLFLIDDKIILSFNLLNTNCVATFAMLYLYM